MGILHKFQESTKNRAVRRAQKRFYDKQYNEAQRLAKLIPAVLARQGGATLATNNKRKVIMNKFRIEQILIHEDYFMFKVDMVHTPWGKGIEVLKDDDVMQTMAIALNRQVRAYYNAGEGFYYMIPRRDGLSNIPTKIDWREVIDLLPDVDKPGPAMRRNWTLPIGVGENKKVQKIDISKTPHVLILGTTGAGKTVFVKNLLLTLVAKNGPKRLRMVICDFKRGPDYRAFARLPHIGMPSAVRTTTEQSDLDDEGNLIEKKKADTMNRILTKLDEITSVLYWAADEIDRRNAQFDESITDINMWNKVHQREYMPHILIVVDELAIIIDELSTKKAGELHKALGRIARLGRSAGIHLVLGIQNLETKYLSGGISNNISTRIVGRFASGPQSGTAIGTGSWAAVKLPEIPGRVIWRNDAVLREIQTPWVDPKFAVKFIDEIAVKYSNNDGELSPDALTVFRWALKEANGHLRISEATKALNGIVSVRTIRAIARDFQSTETDTIDIEIDGHIYNLIAA